MRIITSSIVQDTLFYSPKKEHIDEMIQKLKERGMDFEVEGEVAGFLGINIERNIDIVCTIIITTNSCPKQTINQLMPQSIVCYKDGICTDAVNYEV
jgi:hypothetical protein